MKKLYLAILSFGFLLMSKPDVSACTGISLKSKDNGVVAARTVEWALSDARHNRILIVPRNKSFQALTPKGANGKKWIGKYGFVSLTAYGENFGPDGMNEEGLYVGLYYLPGFTSYAAYEPEQAAQSMSVGDLMQWILSSCNSVKQVKDSLNRLIVVHVDNKSFGGAELPFHFKIADPTGAALVIEFVNNGEKRLYAPLLGVITNAPTYDWHMINLRNYLQLSSDPQKPIQAGNINLSPLGAGSGLMGLPGDYTPPSRFIRAMALTASARPLTTSTDAVVESFRILDNFNIPLGAHVPAKKIPGDIVSATQITTACDLKEKVFYFHTMWNRMIRKIELGSIDFSLISETIIEDDIDKLNNISNITPVVPIDESDELEAASGDTLQGVKCKTNAGYI